ncbi:MAG: metallophosphoesterase family protein [Elainellaceae cyanobacterium]
MPRFLHLADIHLGFDRYDSKERTRDFFEAFYDVLEKYAVADPVDFVLIAGDLFEHRTIQPATLNQAQICLQLLQDANIPAIAIEGNHDNRPYGTRTSWLRYLADWGLLMLLEPGDISAGEQFYAPWNEESKRGGYIDLKCGVRILGSCWYGAAAPRAIEQIVDAIQAMPPSLGPTILLFHHGLEGQIARYAGALRYTEMLPLKQAGVDYLALGHIHKNYEIDNWIFNPGSLEANSIEEGRYLRGAYLVNIDEQGIHASLERDYQQREIIQLRLDLRGHESPEEVEQQAIALVEQAIQTDPVNPDQAPIVELRIEGHVGFDRLGFDVRSLQKQLQQLSNALIFLLKYNVDEVGYVSPLADDASKLQIEYEVFTDLLAAHNTYKNQAQTLAHGLVELKNLQIEDRPEPQLYEFVQSLFGENPDNRTLDS